MARRDDQYRVLEKRIGYRFRSRELLLAALTHRSYRFENDPDGCDNQRLEFLGDAAIGFVAAAYLYKRHPDREEGPLTTFRSRVTSGKALAEVASEIGLGDFLRMGRGEENSGGRKRPSTLADALEAVIGAAYLDGKLRAVRRIFRALFIRRLREMETDQWASNPKGRLQELGQRMWKTGPRYRLVDQQGPAHERVFTVEAELPGTEISETGRGRNKQEAESRAARAMLERLDDAGDRDREPDD